MNHLIHNSHLLRYPLPIWAVVSIVAWLALPDTGLIAIAPWICGALLVVSGAVLGLVCRAIYPRPEAYSIQPMVRLQGTACLVTSLIGVGIWLGFAGGLLAPPNIQMVKIAWLLCSAGFVLSITVARLMLSFIALLPKAAAPQSSSVAVENEAVTNVTRL
ncbi:MAG: hypothetical protein ACI91G_000936 [Gammaproteobacteria bacterium]|jgi:hypothetical protein